MKKLILIALLLSGCSSPMSEAQLQRFKLVKQECMDLCVPYLGYLVEAYDPKTERDQLKCECHKSPEVE